MSLKISLLTHPYNLLIDTNSKTLFSQLAEVYPSHILHHGQNADVFYDFHASFCNQAWRPGSAYGLKLGSQHFRYCHAQSMLPVFEWGFNWFATGFSCHYLSLHAAVVEKNGVSLILPAPPGSGKSTMCALLMLHGWRLLSDEHCLINLTTLEIEPFVRPVSLKNNSIAVMQAYTKQHPCSRVYEDTLKGKMQYLAPTEQSWQGYQTPARPKWVIFPRYQANTPLCTHTLTQPVLFERLLENTFNYSVLGEQSFQVFMDLLVQLHGLELIYSDNEKMLEFVETLR
jgi:hypothetical protein